MIVVIVSVLEQWVYKDKDSENYKGYCQSWLQIDSIKISSFYIFIFITANDGDRSIIGREFHSLYR